MEIVISYITRYWKKSNAISNAIYSTAVIPNTGNNLQLKKLRSS